MSQIDVDVIALGRVVDEGRGSLPFALVHGEALVTCATWALSEAGVLPLDARTTMEGGARRGAPARAARLAVPDDAARLHRRVRTPRGRRGRRGGGRPAGHRHGQGPARRHPRRDRRPGGAGPRGLARRGAGRPGGRRGRRSSRTPGSTSPPWSRRCAPTARSCSSTRRPRRCGSAAPTTCASWKRSPGRCDEPSRDVEVLREGDLEVGRTREHGRDRDVGVPLDAGRRVGPGEAVGRRRPVGAPAGRRARKACGVCTAARWGVATGAPSRRTTPSTGTTGIAPPCSRAAARVRSNRSPSASGRAASCTATTVIAPASISSASTRSACPLGGVPGVAAGDQQHLAVPQVRRQGGLASSARSSGAVHDDHPADGGQRQRGPDRPGDHRDAPQRQQHLVDLGAQPGAGAGRDHHHGGVGPADVGVGHGAKPSQHSYRCRNTPKHALNTRDLPSQV